VVHIRDHEELGFPPKNITPKPASQYSTFIRKEGGDGALGQLLPFPPSLYLKP